MSIATVMTRLEFSKNNQWLGALCQGKDSDGVTTWAGCLRNSRNTLSAHFPWSILLRMSFYVICLIKSKWFFQEFIFTWCTSWSLEKWKTKSWNSYGFGNSGQKCKLFCLLLSLVVPGKASWRIMLPKEKHLLNLLWLCNACTVPWESLKTFVTPSQDGLELSSVYNWGNHIQKGCLGVLCVFPTTSFN